MECLADLLSLTVYEIRDGKERLPPSILPYLLEGRKHQDRRYVFHDVRAVREVENTVGWDDLDFMYGANEERSGPMRGGIVSDIHASGQNIQGCEMGEGLSGATAPIAQCIETTNAEKPDSFISKS